MCCRKEQTLHKSPVAFHSRKQNFILLIARSFHRCGRRQRTCLNLHDCYSRTTGKRKIEKLPHFHYRLSQKCKIKLNLCTINYVKKKNYDRYLVNSVCNTLKQCMLLEWFYSDIYYITHYKKKYFDFNSHTKFAHLFLQIA